MSCEDYETVSLSYLGHDNTTIVIPYSDLSARINYDMSATTEVTISLDPTSSTVTGDDIVASSGDPGPVIWFDNVSAGEWRIYFKAGLFSGVAATEYKARIVIVGPGNTNGVVVCDDLRVDVVDIP